MVIPVGEATAWDHIEQPLRRFLCRVVADQNLHSGPDWRRVLYDAFEYSHAPTPTAECADEVEIHHLLRVIVYHTKGGGDDATRVFSRIIRRPTRLRSLLSYLESLRNKYRHANYVQAREQLADLVLIGRAVKELTAVRSTRIDEDDELSDTIEFLIGSYLLRAAESAELDLPVEAAEPSLVLEGVESALSGVHEALEQLSAAVAALSNRIETTGSQEPGIPSQTAEAEVLGGVLESTLAGVSALSAAVERTRADCGGLLRGQRNILASLSALHNSLEYHLQNRSTGAESAAPEDESLPLAEFEQSHEQPHSSRAASLTYSPFETRDRLIGLRSRIWSELGVRLSADGLLRKAMIDLMISERVTSESEFFQKIPRSEITKTSSAQLRYLPEVFAIVREMR